MPAFYSNRKYTKFEVYLMPQNPGHIRPWSLHLPEKTRPRRWHGIYEESAFTRLEIWGKKESLFSFPLGKGERKIHMAGGSLRPKHPSLRESLLVITSKEVRSSGLGSRCEMPVEMSLMPFSWLFLSCLCSAGPQVFLRALVSTSLRLSFWSQGPGCLWCTGETKSPLPSLGFLTVPKN